ncbi:MAG: T9SS type A sorting domain-containing protein [Saprospiraceae bacterium]
MTTTELFDDLELNMYNYDSGPYWTLQTIDLLNSAKYQASNLQFVAYEGGQHLANFAGTPEDNATSVLIAANRDTRMGDIYTDFYDWWAASGAGTFMTFTSMGEASMFGAWGLLENIEQDTLTAPKWLATTEWIRDNECMTTSLSNVAMDFSGEQVGEQNRLQWRAQQQDFTTSFQLEKLMNDEWTNLLISYPTENQRHIYYEDKSPIEGWNYYRITIFSTDGAIINQQTISIAFQSALSFTVVPNITSDFIHLEFNNVSKVPSTLFQIFNTQGQVVLTGEFASGKEERINVTHLPAGMYFLQGNSKVGKRKVAVFIKR